jgi:hypothetical protein
MESYTIKTNAQYNSTEIIFNGKPSETVRDALKSLRYRWHGVRKLWYGYTDAETVRKAIENAESTGTKTKAKTQDAQKVNRFGVKVGDLFSASWGYEQTNVDFFQVVSLVGDSSVRVREVVPEMIREDAVCSMAADRTYKTNTDGKLLNPVARSIFIKDQEKGDLKRLKSYHKDGRSNPQFSISTYASATLCTGNTQTEYESWYY